MLIIAKIINYYWESIFRVSWTLQKYLCYLMENILGLINCIIILQNAPSEGFHKIESIKAYPAKEAEEGQ